MGRAAPAVVLAILLVGTAPAPAGAYPLPGTTERITSGAANSWIPSISGDGRYVAFQSYVPSLVPGDTNGASDIFVADREKGTVERVSVSSSGARANQHAWSPAITPDGRYVAFNSLASNLVQGDHNGHIDVFVRDRATGTTERVSVSSDGAEGEWTSGGSDGLTGSYYAGRPAISDDGRRVAFWSFANEFDAADVDFARDAFVHDRETRETRLVSVSSTGGHGTCCSVVGVDISGDGRVASFAADVAGLVPGDSNGRYDVFTHDLATGTTERASVGPGGRQSDANAWSMSLSHDGSLVAFSSSATNLVPDDFNSGNGIDDVFVRDRVAGRTERVSVSSDGREANEHSYKAQISPDGRFVTFGSYASNLVPGDTNGSADLFLSDRLTGSVQRLSLTDAGGQVSGGFGDVVPSADGRFVVFEGKADGLVPGDGDSSWNIYVRDVGPPLGIGRMSAAIDGQRVTVSGFARFSGVLLASGTDAAGDGSLQGQAVGADLTGAAIAWRPDLDDLRVRLDLSRLEGRGRAGFRGVVYGLAFRVAGVPYEVRVSRLGDVNLPPRVSSGAALYRCDAQPCTQVTTLEGTTGIVGDTVVASLPLSHLGTPSPALTSVRAFAGAGELAAGQVLELDGVALGDLPPVPAASVGLALTPAGAAEPEMMQPATLTEGRFGTVIEAPGQGSYDLWARACLGAQCASARRRIEITEGS